MAIIKYTETDTKYIAMIQDAKSDQFCTYYLRDNSSEERHFYLWFSTSVGANN